MEFCEECGQLKLPKKLEDGTAVLICSNGHTKEVRGASDAYTLESKRTPSEHEEMIIDDGSTKYAGEALVERYCERCKSVQPTSIKLLQTRSADEAPTRFFTCTTCGTSSREYD